jgi:uncharacterized Fe-S cluster protein YjdI
MENKIKEYTNGEVTVVWKPNLCIHSKICWHAVHGMPEVFNPRERPWIKVDATTTEKLVEQVSKCPSGALSHFMNHEKDAPSNTNTSSINTTIEVTANGPLLVHGTVLVKDTNGQEVIKDKVTALCRCGASANKPYCDGKHKSINFTDKRVL